MERDRRGSKIKNYSPAANYTRNRMRYYYQFKKGKINNETYNSLLDDNLKEYQRDKDNKSLSEFVKITKPIYHNKHMSTYYERNKELVKKKSAEWKKNNKDKVRKYQNGYHRDYYEKNREEIRRYQKEYYKKEEMTSD